MLLIICILTEAMVTSSWKCWTKETSYNRDHVFTTHFYISQQIYHYV